MLNEAQQKMKTAGMEARFVTGDMKKFVVDKPIDAIICACDGVNYLVNDADLVSFFKTCWLNLKVGGVLIFDISSYNKLTNILGNNMFYDDREDVTCLWQNKISNNMLYMELTFFIKEDHLYRRLDEEHIQRAYKIDDVKQLLEGAGFGFIKSYNFLTKEEATEKNERIQFLAVKQ
ncbi:hypothetical protein SDC9_196674 [bioreactor metagenome]|uniref:Methyltransferase domain-containing protein n=1 Tax=bioreactor metagenome TaxID=1076179 RepID=A0A645ICI1_9ZZZZ